MFPVCFCAHKHNKEIKNHPQPVSNIEPFLDLSKWSGIVYPTVINRNNYVLTLKNNCY